MADTSDRATVESPSRKAVDFKAIQCESSRNLDARQALHRRFTPPGKDVWDFVWARYNTMRARSVLEVGCGNGTFWVHPATGWHGRAHLTLTDR